ncbi:cache domain-containing sensor histidine kinase [Priestia abyssalis]|uniref:cache domain-containing sensor histidine kinase n=1 Tax=Priestia abyssalis TaxID=1221450 RepID=UPI0009954E5C|nr:sensor histidine kinase [Priestia abyssalis]
MKFQQKVLVAFLVLILVPIIVLGVVSYQVSSSALKEKVGRETLQTLKATNINLQMVMSEVNSFSNYVIASQEVENFLRYNQEQSIINFYSSGQSMAGLLYTQSRLEDLILYSTRGQVYHFRKSTIPSLEEFRETEFYHRIVNGKGREVWLSPVDNQIFMSGDTPFYIHGRAIRDVDTLEDIGYVIMKIKIERFDDIFMNLHKGDSKEMIVDEEGRIVYHRNRSFIGRSMNLANRSKILSGEDGTVIDYLDGEKSLVTYISGTLNDRDATKYFLVSTKPWHTISNETQYIRQTTFGLVLIVLVFAVLFNLFFLNRIVSFITEFLNKMKRVENGDLTARMPSFNFLELNHLAKSFNEMVEKTVILLQRIKSEQELKRKAEFQVLQNQINPHFLYNTLESINSLAVLNDQQDISKMTIHLGKLLRISINASDEVSVQNEMRHVMSYMEIQKVRYNDGFTFEVSVDEDLFNYRILKLVLQPLVENILIHAFDRKQQDAVIRITGGIDKGKGYFYIEDNGIGIRRDVLKILNERNQGMQARKQMSHGVMNVQNRLKLYYGEPFGLIICSKENEGTTIKLTFPLRKGEEDEV